MSESLPHNDANSMRIGTCSSQTPSASSVTNAVDPLTTHANRPLYLVVTVLVQVLVAEEVCVDEPVVDTEVVTLVEAVVLTDAVALEVTDVDADDDCEVLAVELADVVAVELAVDEAEVVADELTDVVAVVVGEGVVAVVVAVLEADVDMEVVRVLVADDVFDAVTELVTVVVAVEQKRCQEKIARSGDELEASRPISGNFSGIADGVSTARV